MLTILLIFDRLSGVNSWTMIADAVWNLAFLLVQFMCLSFYFRVKYMRWTNLTREHIGWGDILFLLCLGFYLPPINYLFFYLLSLVGVLFVSVCIMVLRRGQWKIPLAGLQAMLLAMVILTNVNGSGVDLNDMDWFLRFLEG